MTTRKEVEKVLSLIQSRMVVSPDEGEERLVFARECTRRGVELLGEVRKAEAKAGADGREEEQTHLKAALTSLEEALSIMEGIERPLGPYIITAVPERSTWLARVLNETENPEEAPE